MRKMSGEQSGSEKRTDDQSGSLHREDQGDEHPTMSLAGILAHNGGGNRIVAADPDPENEPKTDEPPNVGGEGASDCARSKNQHFDTINPLAADHVRDSPEKQSANRCS